MPILPSKNTRCTLTKGGCPACHERVEASRRERAKRVEGFTPTPNGGRAPKAPKSANPTPVMVWGFTLLELLLVMAIIGILASIVLVNFVSGSQEARDARRVREVYQIGHALQMYYSEEGEYPDNTDSDDAGCLLHGVTWDKGHTDLGVDDFIKPILDENIIAVIPVELDDITDPSESACLYRYAKVVNPCGCDGTYAILYAACESNQCPIEGRPACCTDADWFEGIAEYDPYDILIFLEEPES